MDPVEQSTDDGLMDEINPMDRVDVSVRADENDFVSDTEEDMDFEENAQEEEAEEAEVTFN